MPKWLHRTTKAYLRSIAPADLPEAQANYIEDPDLSAVSGQPDKYWKITGDTVSLMTTAEQDAVDAAEAAVVTAANRSEAVGNTSEVTGVGVRVRALIELLNKRDNYLVNRITELQDALIALQAPNGNANNRLNNLPSSYMATNTRTKAAAVTDYTDDINAGNQDT